MICSYFIIWAHRKIWTLLMFVCVPCKKLASTETWENPNLSFQPPATLVKRLLANRSTERVGRCHHEVTIDYLRKVFVIVGGSQGLGRMKMALIFRKGTKEDVDNLGRRWSKSWKLANHPQNYFSAYDWQEGDGVVSMGLQRGKWCLTSLTDFHEDAQWLRGREVDIVCPDFSKAFSTVSHNFLINKVKYGLGKWPVRCTEN